MIAGISSSPLLTWTPLGLYCPKGDFYIDPHRPAPYAIITHAHSDHARAGHQHYLCHPLTKVLLEKRLGRYSYQEIAWNQPLIRNGVQISLHPAGHVAGSSQVRVEYKGEVWVISGDYKLQNDGISGAFEPLRCHTFITESTFALPVYTWQETHIIEDNMKNWVRNNQQQGFHSVFFAYTLGKAQRVAKAIAPITDQIILHSSAYDLHSILQKNNVSLPNAVTANDVLNNPDDKKAVIIAPLSVMNSNWLKKCSPYKSAICSGWMNIRGQARRQDCDTGFVMSDHADWQGLLTAIRETNAEQVLVTHGFQSILSKYLLQTGIDARPLYASFEREDHVADTSESERG
jgi:putative mRNA 3-end processing factor